LVWDQFGGKLLVGGKIPMMQVFTCT